MNSGTKPMPHRSQYNPSTSWARTPEPANSGCRSETDKFPWHEHGMRRASPARAGSAGSMSTRLRLT